MAAARLSRLLLSATIIASLTLLVAPQSRARTSDARAPDTACSPGDVAHRRDGRGGDPRRPGHAISGRRDAAHVSRLLLIGGIDGAKPHFG